MEGRRGQGGEKGRGERKRKHVGGNADNSRGNASTVLEAILKCIIRYLEHVESITKEERKEIIDRLNACLPASKPLKLSKPGPSNNSQLSSTNHDAAANEDFYASPTDALREALSFFGDTSLCECSVDVADITYSKEDAETAQGFRNRLMQLEPKNNFILWKGIIPYCYLAPERPSEFKKKLRQLFSVGSLVDFVNDHGGSDLSHKKYIPNFVKIDGYQFYHDFCTDPSRDSALVVSGESGSGKSTFVQNEFFLGGCACIYHSLVDEDTSHAKTLSKLFKLMKEKGELNSRLYEVVDRIHSDVYKEPRGFTCIDILEALLEERFERHAKLKSWWEGNLYPVERLVAVIDEAGKDENFARGLVYSVREIHRRFIEKKRCKQFKLVLAGSGLDGVFYVNPDYAKFGTDPSRSNVIILRGPKDTELVYNLKQYLQKQPHLKQHIPEAIVNGVYSRVLATNTQVLMDGIIPILKEEMLTQRIDESDLKQRLIDLCSSNIVMDYAARNCARLNALKNMDKTTRQNLLAKSFLFILKASYAKVREYNDHAYDGDVFETLSDDNQTELTLKGLVASNLEDTSLALRYLACRGHTEQLIPADGISFEGVLASHLRRFEYVAKGFPVEMYDLQKAWPRTSTQGFKDKAAVVEELLRAFKDKDDIDVKRLCELLDRVAHSEGKHSEEKLAIVMRQRVPTAQSADVIVLEASNKDNRLTLDFDLFQAKHTVTIPGVESQECAKWLRSIGVKMPNDETFGYHYSDLGIKYLGDCLKKRLETTGNFSEIDVKIRDRFLVVSKKLEETPWSDKEKACQFLKDCGVRLWTRENLEPTISAVKFDSEASEEENEPSILTIDEFVKAQKA